MSRAGPISAGSSTSRARYGHDQLLAIVVPVDEIEKPITDIRNETLLYSIAFLVFALPLFVTLVVVLIDRKLERPAPCGRGSATTNSAGLQQGLYPMRCCLDDHCIRQ